MLPDDLARLGRQSVDRPVYTAKENAVTLRSGRLRPFECLPGVTARESPFDFSSFGVYGDQFIAEDDTENSMANPSQVSRQPEAACDSLGNRVFPSHLTG